jgi:hypothetical protein
MELVILRKKKKKKKRKRKRNTSRSAAKATSHSTSIWYWQLSSSPFVAWEREGEGGRGEEGEGGRGEGREEGGKGGRGEGRGEERELVWYKNRKGGRFTGINSLFNFKFQNLVFFTLFIDPFIYFSYHLTGVLLNFGMSSERRDEGGEGGYREEEERERKGSYFGFVTRANN